MLNSKKTDKEAYMMESFENNEFETFNTLAQKALNHNNLAVRHAAGNAINRLTENNTRQ